MQSQPLTYVQLLQSQSQLVTLGQLNAQTAANRATALRLFLQANLLPSEDVVGSEMRINYLSALQKLVELLREQGRNERSITNTCSALKTWKLAVTADDTIRALSTDQATPFAQAIRTVLEGHPVKRVARQAGVSSDMLFGWLKGKIPRASNAKAIRLIEAFFGLERESLVILAGIKSSLRPREQVGTSPQIEYRETLGARTQNTYYLDAKPDSPLRPQWMELIRYKTAAVNEVLLRFARGRWTQSPLKVLQETPYTWASFLDGNEVPSAKACWNQVASYLGWMALDTKNGGLGIPTEELQTLAWLAVPGHIAGYVEWMRQRCGGKYTGGIFMFLGTVIWMVRPDDGYLFQQQFFQKTLPAGFHSDDWHGLCKRQYDYCVRMKQALAPEKQQTRDPFAPLRPILDLDEPLEAIADMVQRMRLDRPVGSPQAEAIWARDLFLIKLLVSNPLRKRNIAALTWNIKNKDGYRPDNECALYQRSDKSWWISVPKNLLKNRRGGQAIKDYDSPVHPSVWRDLERYVLHHRSNLMRWPTDLVFLTRTRDPKAQLTKKGQENFKKPAPQEHLPNMELGRQVMALTKKYLWKSGGVGTHSFRHIVATSIIKAPGGSTKTAALVLNDRESTVENHYSGLRSGDGAIRMGELLGKSLNRM